MAGIKRFTTSTPCLKNYRFRLFDIPLMHSFYISREWNGVTAEELEIIRKRQFPKWIFNSDEMDFLKLERQRFVLAYESALTLREPN